MYPKTSGIPTYAFFYLGGMLAHYVITCLLARRVRVRIRWALLLSTLYALAMVIGAKVLYDLIYGDFRWRALVSPEHYSEGGLWGGPMAYLAAAVPFILLLARQKRAVLDVVAWSLPVPLILAKLGCLAQGCCHGVPSGMPWAMRFAPGGAAPTDQPLHPTQAYEIVMLVIILAAFVWLDRERWQGTALLWFLLLYGLGRPLIEIWRADAHHVSAAIPVSIAQIICLAAAGAALITLVTLHRRREPPADTPARPLDLPNGFV